jgi:acetyl esterase/lipase
MVEYGFLVGAQIDAITKSGSNQVHGDAYYGWNGRAVNANSYVNKRSGVARSFDNVNQVQTAAGGPIIRNKTFFFADYEYYSILLPTSTAANPKIARRFAVAVYFSSHASQTSESQNQGGSPMKQTSTVVPLCEIPQGLQQRQCDNETAMPSRRSLDRRLRANQRNRLYWMPCAFFAGVSSLAIGAQVVASNPHVDAVTHNPPGASQVVRLYPGVAPGSEGATQVEVSDDGLRVRNVTVPELIVYKPKAGSPHTGAAVIVAPGGGFQHLSIINEGSAVAERLAASGITGIVLKYRLAVTSAAPRTNLAAGAGARDDFARTPRPPRPAGAAPGTGEGSAPAAPRPQSAVRTQGHADAEAAVRYVRTHAVELGVSPDRIGFVGFSAGAELAIALEIATDPDVRPNFVGSIYSPAPQGSPAADAPPLFLAVAADDTTVGPSASLKMAQDWQTAKIPIELHLFNSGSHGFGMSTQGKTSDHWLDEFIWWLTEPNGVVKLATK